MVYIHSTILWPLFNSCLCTVPHSITLSHTVAVSVSKTTVLVAGVTITKCAVELMHPVRMQQLSYRYHILNEITVSLSVKTLCSCVYKLIMSVGLLR